jgi:hypothetical protein
LRNSIFKTPTTPPISQGRRFWDRIHIPKPRYRPNRFDFAVQSQAYIGRTVLAIPRASANRLPFRPQTRDVGARTVRYPDRLFERSTCVARVSAVCLPFRLSARDVGARNKFDGCAAFLLAADKPSGPRSAVFRITYRYTDGRLDLGEIGGVISALARLNVSFHTVTKRPNRERNDHMIFHATDAPLGASPEADPDAIEAYALCVEATSGFVPAINAIKANPELSAPSPALPAGRSGQEVATAKLEAERAPKTARAAELVKRRKDALAKAGHEHRAAAGLGAPAADSASGWRAQESRAAFAALSPSGRNAVLNGPDTDRETLLALFHSPQLTNTLSARDRETVEDRLLDLHDSARHAAHKAAVEDLRRAEYALGVALGFTARSRSPLAGLRERVEALNRK